MTNADKIRERLLWAKSTNGQETKLTRKEAVKFNTTNRFRLFTGCTVRFMINQSNEWLETKWAQFVLQSKEEVTL